MQTSDLVLVQGIARTRATLSEWNDRPWPVLGGWLAGSLAIALLLLAAVLAIAMTSSPESSRFIFPGLNETPSLGDVG